METINIKIKSLGGKVPEYKTGESAGCDLAAYLPDGAVCIEPGERMLVPTGIYMEIPRGYEGQVRARSGLAINKGIGLVNGIGTVDADYRGEFLVPLINWGCETFVINHGDRIAQVVFNKVATAKFTLVEELEESSRGEGGFGSTGV